jgi:hypothetical protein
VGTAGVVQLEDAEGTPVYSVKIGDNGLEVNPMTVEN